MALRLIQVGNSLPVSYPVDPSSSFQPGMIAQLKAIGNDIVAGVSDGTAPLGIIDDTITNAFTAPSVDEVVIIQGTPNQDGYFLVAAKEELRFSNVIRSSFDSNVDNLILNDINGVLIAPVGTRYNYDSDGDGILDSLMAVVTYYYRIPNVPGDDTTLGSGRMTIWVFRGLYETDQFDPHAVYAVNASLFVSPEGLLTTTQSSVEQVRVGIVTGPPSPLINTLEFMWF